MEEAMRMNEERFLQIMDHMHQEEKAEHARKSADYADRSGGNVLQNFDDDAAELGITSEFDLWIFLNKHLRAIRNYCRHGSTTSEGIEGRIKDARVYLALLRSMVERRKSSYARDLEASSLNDMRRVDQVSDAIVFVNRANSSAVGLGPK